LYSEYLTKEALEGVVDFRIGGQVTRIVIFADDIVLLAREWRCFRAWLEDWLK